jgi:hypothetical protein
MAGGLGRFVRQARTNARDRRNAATLAQLEETIAGLGLAVSNGQIVVDGAAVDHGTLGGLGDDDHPQYTRTDTLTTKGDLYVRNATVVTRQGVGSNGTVLVADSVQANGVRYGDHGDINGLSDDDHTQYLLDDAGTGGDGIAVASRVVSVDLVAGGGLEFAGGQLQGAAATPTMAGVLRQLNNIAELNQTISDPPTQVEVQAISDKIDELLAELIAQGVMAGP